MQATRQVAGSVGSRVTLKASLEAYRALSRGEMMASVPQFRSRRGTREVSRLATGVVYAGTISSRTTQWLKTAAKACIVVPLPASSLEQPAVGSRVRWMPCSAGVRAAR